MEDTGRAYCWELPACSRTAWAGLPANALDFLKTSSGEKESRKAQEALPSGMPGSEQGKRSKAGRRSSCVLGSRAPRGRPGSLAQRARRERILRPSRGSVQAPCSLQTPSSGLEGALSWSTRGPGVRLCGDAELIRLRFTGHPLCAEQHAEHFAYLISSHPQEAQAPSCHPHFTEA